MYCAAVIVGGLEKMAYKLVQAINRFYVGL